MTSTMKSPINREKGQVSWDHKPGDLYLVTGQYYRSNKRFRSVYQDWNYARCINLWKGTKWLLREGKRYKIVSVVN
jgi:hypothetical protein